MAKYISIDIHVDKGISLSDLLAPAFETSFFTPVAAAALHSNWLLNGFALESFVEQFTRQRQRPSLSIDLAPSVNGGDADYLQKIKDGVLNYHQARVIAQNYSPFERVLKSFNVTTMMPNARIALADLRQVEAWMANRQSDAAIRLFGTTAISVDVNGTPKIIPAFRLLYEQRPVFHVLEMRFIRGRMDSGMGRFSISCHSLVWLHNNFDECNGHITPACANENLRALALFAKSFTQSRAQHIEEILLDTEGRVFYDERDRIYQAFNDAGVKFSLRNG